MDNRVWNTPAARPAATSGANANAPYPLIVGICGEMGSGKDTLAEFLCRPATGYTLKKFATGVRRAAELLTGVPADEMEQAGGKARLIPARRMTPDGFQCAVDYMVSHVTGRPASPREVENFSEALCTKMPDGGLEFNSVTVGRLLQLLGTECFRRDSPSVWVDYWRREWEREGYKKVVIADVRYQNEAETIRSWSGVIVRVSRPDGRAHSVCGRDSAHSSETPLPVGLVDLELVNNSSPEALGGQLLSALPVLGAIAAARCS